MENKILKIALCFVLFCICIFAYSQEDSSNKFEQRIEWKGDSNALEYKVELQDMSSGNIQYITTEESYAELSLPAGKYRYRVYAYDFLGRQAGVSSWTDFEILKASVPQIAEVTEADVVAKDDGSVEIKLDIEGISEGSIVELIAEPIQGTIVLQGGGEGSEVADSSSVQFNNIPSGQYRLRVTNPSGLSSETDVIEITGTTLVGEQYNTKTETEIVYVPEPVVVEEEEPKDEVVIDIKPVFIDDTVTTIEPEVAVYKKRTNKNKKPYAEKGFDIQAFGGTQFLFTSFSTVGTLLNTDNVPFYVDGGFRINYYPFKKAKWRLGMGLGFSWVDFYYINDYFTASLVTTTYQFNIIYQHRFFHDKLFYTIRGGIGLAHVNKDVTYLTDGEGLSLSNNSYTGSMADLGLALSVKPATYLMFELGLDCYAYTFPEIVLSPYFAVGIRL